MSDTVFVSYSSFSAADIFVVHNLEEDLRKRGIKTWIDIRDIRPGQPRVQAWHDGIKASGFFLACLSPFFFADELCQTQTFLARLYGKRLLPILVHEFNVSPFDDMIKAGNDNSYSFKGLEELLILNFSGLYPGWGIGSDYVRNFEKLVEAISPIPDPVPLNSKLLYISHAWEDKDFAYNLATDLKHARQRVWLDTINMRAGFRWRDEMYDGLNAADHLLVCLSEAIIKSPGVQREVQAAQMRGLQIYSVIPESVYQDSQRMRNLDTAIRQSAMLKSLSEREYFVPEEGYSGLIDNLKQALDLVDPDRRKQGIFISYRRQDSAPIAGRIHEKLVARFGAETVFMDVLSIQPGQNFVEVITGWLTKSAIVLVIIGSKWATIEISGKRRLHDDGDYVRMEVAAALEKQEMHDVKVIPVLVDGATMPAKEELPENLQRLSHINAATVRNDPDFPNDIQVLIDIIANT